MDPSDVSRVHPAADSSAAFETDLEALLCGPELSPTEAEMLFVAETTVDSHLELLENQLAELSSKTRGFHNVKNDVSKVSNRGNPHRIRGIASK